MNNNYKNKPATIAIKTKEVRDSNGNITYEEYSSGYKEYNTYSEYNKLIRSESHYPNGIIEVEHFAQA